MIKDLGYMTHLHPHVVEHDFHIILSSTVTVTVLVDESWMAPIYFIGGRNSVETLERDKSWQCLVGGLSSQGSLSIHYLRRGGHSTTTVRYWRSESHRKYTCCWCLRTIPSKVIRLVWVHITNSCRHLLFYFCVSMWFWRNCSCSDVAFVR